MVVVEHGGEGRAARRGGQEQQPAVAGGGHLAVGGWGDGKVRGAVSSVGWVVRSGGGGDNGWVTDSSKSKEETRGVLSFAAYGDPKKKVKHACMCTIKKSALRAAHIYG